MKKIVSIVGARPQFIKHAPVQVAMKGKIDSVTIHTGQHYDDNMSSVFFNELKIPKPEYTLNNVKSSFHGEQTALMLIEIEKILLKENPDFILIYGDTNSTLSGALAAVKLGIPIIHIEAGLRSFNRSMPEEINRILSDQVSELLFCPNYNAKENLIKEGINEKKIEICGDVMCDILYLVENKLSPKLDYDYYYATIHRPYNTDDKDRLFKILNQFNSLNKKVIFSIHPRTFNLLKNYQFNFDTISNIELIEPQSYIDNLSYQKFSSAVITDSGGMQKEAYMLKKPCLTIRSETEWIETLGGNWNQLVFDNLDDIPTKLSIKPDTHIDNLYGDGKAAEYIINRILAIK